MRAVFVIVADIIGEQSFQMKFIQRNDVIQQVPSAVFDPTLRHAVLPGTLEGGPYRADIQSTNRCPDFQPIIPIPVEDQKPGGRMNRDMGRQDGTTAV